MDRRKFLQMSSVGAGAIAAASTAKAAPSERVRVGMVGGGGRALSLCRTFSENKQAEIVSVADVDPRRLPRAVQEITSRQGKAPTTTNDFRKIIDDNLSLIHI